MADQHKTQGKKGRETDIQGGKAPGGKQDGVQGEGDYAAARRFDQEQERFAQSGRVDEAARQAAPRDQKEAEEMKRAEEDASKHAKGEDPALKRKGTPKKGA